MPRRSGTITSGHSICNAVGVLHIVLVMTQLITQTQAEQQKIQRPAQKITQKFKVSVHREVNHMRLLLLTCFRLIDLYSCEPLGAGGGVQCKLRGLTCSVLAGSLARCSSTSLGVTVNKWSPL